MADIHIKEFVRGRTQQQVAELMGVTQGAIHQMIKSDREIFFRQIEGGGFDFYEIKKPRTRKAA